jgi:hypothetical protein
MKTYYINKDIVFYSFEKDYVWKPRRVKGKNWLKLVELIRTNWIKLVWISLFLLAIRFLIINFS